MLYVYFEAFTQKIQQLFRFLDCVAVSICKMLKVSKLVFTEKGLLKINGKWCRPKLGVLVYAQFKMSVHHFLKCVFYLFIFFIL